MEETASERGTRVIEILTTAGQKAGLEVHREYPVVGGRVDIVWLWRGPNTFPSLLPLVAFEVESSWRTRKHLKGNFLNLLDLQPALGVIVLLGQGADVESTRRFTKHMIDRRGARIEVWSEKDVLTLADDQAAATSRLLSELPTPEVERQPVPPVAHSGKYWRLAAWLASQPTDQVEAKFADIEEVLGFPLPSSSRKHSAHWRSYEGSAVARAIHDAGWKVASLDLQAEKVTFER